MPKRILLIVAILGIVVAAVALLTPRKTELTFGSERVILSPGDARNIGDTVKQAVAGPALPKLIRNPTTSAEKMINGAKKEVIKGVLYDAGYVSIPYPNGDVAANKGACTEVVIRGLRNAGYDLQKLVHEDMKRNFRLYPRRWGLNRPDPSIDHRRVPNLMVFFKRFAKSLPIKTTGTDKATWRPGDIVCWDLTGNGLTHIGVLSNELNSAGTPLILHNIGPSASQEDCLTSWKIMGHYRYPK